MWQFGDHTEEFGGCPEVTVSGSMIYRQEKVYLMVISAKKSTDAEEEL